MKRREFIGLLGAAPSRPLPLSAQQGDRVHRIARVGILNCAALIGLRPSFGSLHQYGIKP
jgi:hypothetical protein